LTQTTKELILL